MACHNPQHLPRNPVNHCSPCPKPWLRLCGRNHVPPWRKFFQPAFEICDPGCGCNYGKPLGILHHSVVYDNLAYFCDGGWRISSWEVARWSLSLGLIHGRLPLNCCSRPEQLAIYEYGLTRSQTLALSLSTSRLSQRSV